MEPGVTKSRNALVISEVKSLASESDDETPMAVSSCSTTDANIPITQVLASPPGSDLRSAFVMETDDEDSTTSFSRPTVPVTYQPRRSLMDPNSQTQPSEESDSEDNEGPMDTSDDNERQQDILKRYFNHELTFSEFAVLSGDVDAEEGGPGGGEPKTPTKAPVARTRAKRKRRLLPPALQGLMGEANLTYARGDFATAEKMCLEVIRQCPEDPTAFSTLAVLYEEQNLPEKSLQVALIAALLSPGDPTQWIRLAVLSEEQGNVKQAIHCYTKAIRADPQNIENYIKKGSLLQSLKDTKGAMRCYSKLITILTPEKASLILSLAKEIADFHHKEGELNKALEAMEVAFTKVPKDITSEHVNLMLELRLQAKDYMKCLEILVGFCDVEVEFEAGPMSQESEITSLGKLVNCKWPEYMPIDIWVKLGLVLIHLKAFHLVDEFIQVMTNKLNCEEAGDLYLDMAEALMSVDRHKDALPLLEILVNSENYSLAAVWLRLAECLKACGKLEESINAYNQVVEQAPQQVDVRVTLATMLTALRRDEQAINVLTQDADSEALDAGLLYKKCMLLREGGKERHEEFLAVGQLLLSRHCVRVRNREELDALCRLRRIDKKNVALREIRTSRGEPDFDHDAPDFADSQSSVPTVEEEWALLKDMCNICLEEGRTGLLQRLAFSALGSVRFYTQAHGLECEFLSLLASYYNADAYHGYNLARDLIIRENDYPRAWNLFNLVIQRADDVRHNRFIMRCLTRHPNNAALAILHANNCLVAGTYKYALNEYAAAFRKDESPMLAFLLGVTLIQMACQKFSAKKHALVSQGIAFLWKYQKLRGPLGGQEVHYNLGRAFHQLGLLSVATHHYKEVLSFSSHLTETYPTLLDLKREAAFNLHLIYKASGEYELAQKYIDDYIII